LRRVKVRLDSSPAGLDLELPSPVTGFELFSDHQPVSVTSFELTIGFEELFEHGESIADDWKIESAGMWHIRAGELVAESQENFSLFRKNVSLVDLDFTVNIRMPQPTGQAGLVLRGGGSGGFHMMLDAENRNIRLSDGSIHDLPHAVDLARYHQLKAVKKGSYVIYFFDEVCLGSAGVTDIEVEPRISATRAAFAIEMIRVTGI